MQDIKKDVEKPEYMDGEYHKIAFCNIASYQFMADENFKKESQLFDLKTYNIMGLLQIEIKFTKSQSKLQIKINQLTMPQKISNFKIKYNVLQNKYYTSLLEEFENTLEINYKHNHTLNEEDLRILKHGKNSQKLIKFEILGKKTEILHEFKIKQKYNDEDGLQLLGFKNYNQDTDPQIQMQSQLQQQNQLDIEILDTQNSLDRTPHNNTNSNTPNNISSNKVFPMNSGTPSNFLQKQSQQQLTTEENEQLEQQKKKQEKIEQKMQTVKKQMVENQTTLIQSESSIMWVYIGLFIISLFVLGFFVSLYIECLNYVNAIKVSNLLQIQETYDLIQFYAQYFSLGIACIELINWILQLMKSCSGLIVENHRIFIFLFFLVITLVKAYLATKFHEILYSKWPSVENNSQSKEDCINQYNTVYCLNLQETQELVKQWEITYYFYYVQLFSEIVGRIAAFKFLSYIVSKRQHLEQELLEFQEKYFKLEKDLKQLQDKENNKKNNKKSNNKQSKSSNNRPNYKLS